MNKQSRNRSGTKICLGAALFAGNLLAYFELGTSQGALRAAADNLADCRALAAEIKTLRGRPSRVTWGAHSATDFSSQVEQALRFAQLPANCLVRVDPQPARRLAATDFKEQPTSLELRAVTLKQLIHFLHNLESSGVGLRTKSLQLAASTKPTAGAAAETWNAQVLLTTLIFAPKKVSSS